MQGKLKQSGQTYNCFDLNGQKALQQGGTIFDWLVVVKIPCQQQWPK